LRFGVIATGYCLIGGRTVDKEIGQLLSWYVNGTLTGADRDRVEAALREDPRAKALLDWEKSLRQAVKNDASLDVAEDRGLSQVMQRIRMESKPAATISRRNKPSSGSAPSRLFEWFRWSPALALACGIVAVQFGVIVHLYQVRGEEEAYAGVRSVKTKRAESFVRVSFRPETTENELRTLLRELQAEIVSGPSQLGDYYLVVKSDTVQSMLTALQSSPHVESAEIVNALPSRPS
jgi:anti-sigma-K factor RskA